jgi:glycine cleavage system regulatory protein
MIDNIRLKQIGNGFTVRYHIKDTVEEQEKGYIQEMYVKDKAGVIEFVTQLLNTHIN